MGKFGGGRVEAILELFVIFILFTFAFAAIFGGGERGVRRLWRWYVRQAKKPFSALGGFVGNLIVRHRLVAGIIVAAALTWLVIKAGH